MIEASVVVVSYRRLETLEAILAAWLRIVPEVWLADCTGGRFKTELPIRHVRFSRDEGSRTRHALALLAGGEFVIKADDDLVPLPGLLEDFRTSYAAVGDGILGLIGRRFVGPRYYGETSFYRASAVQAPVEVDFVGVCTYAPRKYLAFDLQGCGSPIEDLFWQMRAFPAARKYVLPTQKYRNLPSSSDKGCLFHDAKAREQREAFYSKYYLLYYEGKTTWTRKNT